MPGWVLHEVSDFAETTCVCVSRGIRRELASSKEARYYLRHQHHASLDEVVVLTARLRYLRIEHSDLSGSLEPLSVAFCLRRLSLAGSDAIQGSLKPLQKLSHLRYLNLHGCGKIRGDLSPLAGLPIENLRLSWCEGLYGDIAPLALLPFLRYLNLDWCIRLTGSLARALAFHPVGVPHHISVVRASRLSGVLELRARGYTVED